MSLTVTNVGQHRLDAVGVHRLTHQRRKRIQREELHTLVRRLHLHGKHSARRPQLFALAMRKVSLPLRVVQRVGQKRGLVGLGGIVAALRELPCLQVVACGKTRSIGLDHHVGELAVAVFRTLDAHGEGSPKHAEDRVQIALADRLQLQRNRQNHVRVHRLHIRRGQVFEDRSIHKLVPVKLERTEDTGDGCGRAHGVLQRSA